MSKLLKIVLNGGTGNQLFQFANALNLSVLNNHHFFLEHTRGSRPFTLDWWNLDLKSKYFYTTNNLLCTKIKTVDKWGFKNKYVNYEHHFSELPEFFEKTEVFGYYQSLNYFKDVGVFLKDFLLRNFLYEHELTLDERTVLIHIRLGDYLSPNNQHIFPTVDDKFIDQALENMRTIINFKQIEIVTDDISTMKQLLPKTYNLASKIYDLNSKDSFELILKSRNKIISNSTFSWWAAWLGDGNVIAPINWFKDSSGLRFIQNEFFPKHWVIV
jgi:hypothetical protein